MKSRETLLIQGGIMRFLRPKHFYTFFLSLFLLTQSAFAVNDAFERRFHFIRNDSGEVVEVRDRSLSFRFSVRPYLEQIKRHLYEEQAMMAEKGDYYYEVESLFADDMYMAGEKSSERMGLLIDSLKQIEDLDLDAIFNDPHFQEVIDKFEERMASALSRINPTVLARLDDPTFFYYRHVTYQVVSWGLSLAKRMLSSVPALNTASYILVETEKLITERRLYHQNMLMHYLQEHEEEIGLEANEVDHIYSSIFESRIPWFAFWESRRARSNWDQYGIDNFYSQVRAGNNRFRQNRHLYAERGVRHNYAFQDVVTQDGNHLIVNLLDGDNFFNSSPAVAFDYDSPNKVVRKRVLLQLGGLGTSFLPIPQFMKDIAQSYFKSFYQSQKLTEGALFAHFEVQGDRLMKERLMVQYLNPFDSLLIFD